MLDAKDVVVWMNDDSKEVMVRTQAWRCPEEHGMPGHWADPIGAAYTQWSTMTDQQRVGLMLETAIDLTMQGFEMADILRAFAGVKQFRALGDVSYPMCRALTKALVGTCLEFNTMSFEELLQHYGKAENQFWKKANEDIDA
jgi:hypothetical protein